MCLDVSQIKGMDAFPGGEKTHLHSGRGRGLRAGGCAGPRRLQFFREGSDLRLLRHNEGRLGLTREAGCGREFGWGSILCG